MAKTITISSDTKALFDTAKDIYNGANPDKRCRNADDFLTELLVIATNDKNCCLLGVLSIDRDV